MFPTLDRLAGWVTRATDLIVAVLGIAMIFCLVLQVFSRYVLGATFIWTEEAALILFTWLLLLAMSAAIYRDGHVRLLFVVNALPQRPRQLWLSFLSLVVLVFCVVFAWSGIHYVEYTVGQFSAAIRYPIELLHLAAPVSGVLSAFQAINRLLNPLIGGDGVAV